MQYRAAAATGACQRQSLVTRSGQIFDGIAQIFSPADLLKDLIVLAR
jgi:hypothetical protein